MTPLQVRVPDVIAARVKKLARKNGMSEPETWRNIIARGLEQDEQINTRIVVETLCILRLQASKTDPDLLKKAIDHTRIILREINEWSPKERAKEKPK